MCAMPVSIPFRTIDDTVVVVVHLHRRELLRGRCVTNLIAQYSYRTERRVCHFTDYEQPTERQSS